MKRQPLLISSRQGLGSLLIVLLLTAQPIFSSPPSPPIGIEVTCHVASALQGVVRDEDQQPLAGVNIYLKSTNIGTSTNEKGEFVFLQKLNAGDIIVFSFVGLETKEYVVPINPPDSLEITMRLDSTMMMGELVLEEVNKNTVKEPLVPRILNKVKSIF